MERKFGSKSVIEMTATVVTLDVLYGQLAVFSSDLTHPYNDWTEKHVAQGFAWRPGSVSFRTLVESGTHSVEVDIVERLGPISANVIRAIEVPFDVPTGGAIEVGSIANTVPLSLPTGRFLLRCEFSRTDRSGVELVRLSFSKNDTPRFAILRADATLSTAGELLTNASPASI